jgi:hypothetical protein
MKKGATKKSSTFSELLGTTSPQPSEGELITLIGMVRPGKASDNFEIALDDTGRWVSLPQKLVVSAEEAGTISLAGTTYKVLKMTIARPEQQGEWFDLLAFSLRRITLILQMKHKCSCTGSKAPERTPRMANPEPTTSTANCVACWIFTLGSAPEFCYKFGHCDN